MTFVLDNWALFVALAVVLAALAWAPLMQRLRGIQTIPVSEAVRLINRERAVVVDVRDPEEFQGGHIPAALNLPLKGLSARLGDIEKHKQRPIILSCRTSSQRSLAAASVLAKAGFSSPVVLAGGFTAWQGENLPTEK
jgi:rhodanese-related sulfurtransferase